MKSTKHFIAMLMMFFCIGTILSSCSDDDPQNEPSQPAATEINGNYTSTISCNIMGQTLSYDNTTLEVKAIDNSTCDLTFGDFGEGKMTIKSLSMPGVKVSGSNGKIALSQTSFSGKAADGKDYSGKIQGTFENGTININFTLKYGTMPMEMICTYSAKKQ